MLGFSFLLFVPVLVAGAAVSSEFSQTRTCSPYKIVEDIVGDAFYDHFTWFTDPDPTHGRTKYVDLLFQTSLNSLIMLQLR